MFSSLRASWGQSLANAVLEKLICAFEAVRSASILIFLLKEVRQLFL